MFVNIPYIKGYVYNMSYEDDYYVDGMDGYRVIQEFERMELFRKLYAIKDFIPVSQIKWYNENALKYPYKRT